MKLSAHPDRKWLMNLGVIGRSTYPTWNTRRGPTPTQNSSKYQPHFGARQRQRVARRHSV